ncbi:MAG: LytTR family transcriptional regulator, partial [Lachnospiraceae bacterium]|nr:LytTR family transcriptional regulator [Lachnospiraceae bacterium]
FVSIPSSRIEYIENVSRILDIHLADGESIRSIFIRKSFDSEIEGLLKGNSFLQVHKSFVINMKYVKTLTQNNVIMESGKSIPISKARSAGVKKEYLLYVSEQYR